MERADETAHKVGALFVLACVDELLSKLLKLVGLDDRFAVAPTDADSVEPLCHAIHGDARECQSIG